MNETTGARAYTPGNCEEVQAVIHQAMDALEKLSKDFQDGKVNTPQFWKKWYYWDDIGKAALASLKPAEQQTVITSRQTLHITGFPSTGNPRK